MTVTRMAGLLLLAALFTDHASAALRFQLTILASPSDSGTVSANAINDSGQITGVFTDSTVFLYHAVYWGNPALPPQVITGEGQDAATGFGINASGTIAGSTSEGFEGFRWNGAGDLQTLPNLTFCCGQAHSINDAGIIAGASTIANGAAHAVRWTNGVIADLGTLQGDCCNSSEALSINNSGAMCGYSGNKAVIWSNQQIIDLNAPGDQSNIAVDINNNGEVAGYCYFDPPISATKPFVWSKGVVTMLGTLGGPHGMANALNDYGWIAGQSFLQPPPSPIHATLWRNGQTIDLNNVTISLPIGSVLENAADINNSNQIVGSGWFGGHPGAFLLNQIPSADITADGHINVDDLIAVINAWGPCPGSGICAADVDENHIVNVDDLLAVINQWSL